MERQNVSDENTKTDYGTAKYKEEEFTWCFWRRRRYILAVLAFFGFFVSYILRVNLSVAIVAITENVTVTDESGKVIGYHQEFDWDGKVQGLVLSSFFYGYIITQLLGGWLGARIGGKRVFGLGIAVTAVFTIVTPPLTKANVYYLVAIRVIEGVFEGVTYPCLNAMWANWAPPLERSMLVTFAFSGIFVGTVFALPVGGIMAQRLGWESIFYGFGAIGIIWFICWWIIAKDKPDDDPYISQEELSYIKLSLGNVDRKRIVHPWKTMLKSVPVWAIISAHFTENWGLYTLLTQLPTYMNDVLNYKLEEAGFSSSIPHLVVAIVLPLSGHLADYLRSKEILTTTQVRIVFTCGAFLSKTVFMTAAAFVTNSIGAVACLTVAAGLGAFGWTGFGVNHLDIAPQHASVIVGISNTIATLPGIISPIITGFIVQEKSAMEWRIVFILSGSIYLIGAIIYGLFASGEIQTWADDTKKKDGTANENAAEEVETF